MKVKSWFKHSIELSIAIKRKKTIHADDDGTFMDMDHEATILLAVC